jgi:CHAD domain-containing protein
VARPRDVPGFDCDEPFALAAARVVEVRAEEVFAHSTDGVLGIDDIEPLHDMRVATRRLRAALEVFRPCFPRKRYRRALKPLKALADALGERRDRDVSIEFLEGFLPDATAADRGRLEILLGGLREEQGEANEGLVPFLAEERLGSLRDALAELVEVART